MTQEYTLSYFRFGASLDEPHETLDSALTRSAEILHRQIGCPRAIARKGVVVYDQESLFTDWLRSLQP